MIRKKNLVFLLLIGLTLTFSDYGLPDGQEDLEVMEKYLKTAAIGPSWKPVGKRTESYIVILDDGKTIRRGFMKFTNRTRPNHQFPFDSYKYELAAYELDKLFGLRLIPPVVERTVGERNASLQILIEDFITEEYRRRHKVEPPDPAGFERTLDELKILEHLTYSFTICEQTSMDDILIDHERGWKIWRVDFSQAFDIYTEISPGCEISRCSKELYQKLSNVKDKTIRSKVKKYLNTDEITTLLKRKGLVIERLQRLIKEKGEDAVLF